MAELRQDPISGRWVILAPDRALRPHAEQVPLAFPVDADDPFAEGREAETPGELLAVREPGTLPDQPGWRVRVFPNKYPATTTTPITMPANGPFTVGAAAVGPHEVIVESPRFVRCLSELSVTAVEEVVWVYRERLRTHRRLRSAPYVMVFKNQGPASGATLAHAHAQLLGTPWIPPGMEAEYTQVARYFAETGRSLFDDWLQSERQARVRVVSDAAGYVVLCPYASRVSGETWIVPTNGPSRFEECDDFDLARFARVLRQTLQRLQQLIPMLPYNFAIHSAPYEREVPGYRWHLELIPRVGNIGGFEWGGGSYVNALPPEAAAAQLQAMPITG
jgi:UDPglucose--hexose-1-phosphate uridylyltransferase